MLSENERAYHAGRARDELDRARLASSAVVADVHAQLSALHAGRLRDVDEDCDGSDCRSRR